VDNSPVVDNSAQEAAAVEPDVVEVLLPDDEDDEDDELLDFDVLLFDSLVFVLDEERLSVR
jgi:hypothetical protein